VPHYYDGGYYNALARLMCLFGPTVVHGGSDLHGGSDYDSWDMGVRASGLIEQKIHEDTNPTDIRIKSAQTLLNVQILNSVAFESITGTTTLPTPVAPEDYISAGLPFFKEYLEVKSEGSPGPRGFTNFSTVQELDAVKQICSSNSPAAGSFAECKSCRKSPL
jgi:hypothetical protein